jgi:hypothetical protein
LSSGHSDGDAVGKIIIDAILARLDALETALHGRPRRRLTKGDLAKQEGITTRSVDRRVAEGKLPPADDVINGRLYWWSDSLERHRKAAAADTADTAAARAERNPQRLRKPKPHPAPEI